MATYRFVHAADLHLDSPFTGMLSTAPEVARVLQAATFSAFDAIIRLCIDEHADALLIAGDVFDSADRSLAAQLAFEQGLRRLGDAGIPAFVCHGNHDPLDAWHARITLPPSVFRFGPEVGAAPLRPDDPDSPMVYGISYPKREVRENLVPRFKEHVQPGRTSIGLLHANVGGDTTHENYAHCSLSDLAASGIRYWALGHVHTARTDAQDGMLAAYPGNPQGRNPNETGARGVLLVDVSEDGQFTPQFRPVDVVRWTHLELSIEGLSDQQELEATVQQRLEHARRQAEGRHLVYRLTLTGRGVLHRLVCDPAFASALAQLLNGPTLQQEPFAYCERVRVATRPALDRGDLLQTGGFVGDLIRLVEDLPKQPGAMAELQGQLHALLESQRFRNQAGTGTPELDGLAAMLPQAEARILDLLVGDDEA